MEKIIEEYHTPLPPCPRSTRKPKTPDIVTSTTVLCRCATKMVIPPHGKVLVCTNPYSVSGPLLFPPISLPPYRPSTLPKPLLPLLLPRISQKSTYQALNLLTSPPPPPPPSISLTPAPSSLTQTTPPRGPPHTHF